MAISNSYIKLPEGTHIKYGAFKEQGENPKSSTFFDHE